MSTVFRVEKKSNYTVMSNMHLKDRRLSYKSKGLLSVILSLPPEWDYTITGLAIIAADGVESVKSAIRELEKYGYVTRRQTRDERGRMSSNEYLVYENPAENPAYVSDEQENGVSADVDEAEKPVKTVKKTLSESRKRQSIFVSPSTDLPSTENPLTDNAGAATISKLNKNILYTKKSIPSVNCASHNDEGRNGTNFSKRANSSSDLQEWDYYYSLISDHIEMPIYARDMRVRDQVEEFVTIMTDVVCSKSPTIRVNGEATSQELVKKRFLQLTSEDIDCVLDSLKNRSGNTSHTRNYLITVLFNAFSTKSNKYSIMAYNDMRVCAI